MNSKTREDGRSSLCLHQFDKFCKWRAINHRKRKLCEFAETCLEKLVKSRWANLFPASFSQLEPLCRRTSSSSAVGAYIASIAFSCAASQTSEDWSEYGTGTHIAEAIDDGGRRRPFRLEDIYCSWEKQDHSCLLATSIGNSLLLVTEFFYTIWHNIDRQLSPQQQRCVQWRCWSLL